MDLIVITHGHADHYGSLPAIKAATNARVAVHALEADAIRTGRITEVRPTNRRGKLLLKLVSETIAGSLSILLPGGAVIVGDLIFGGFVARKRPIPPLVAMDMERVKESIIELLSHSPKLFYVSHGGPFPVESVQKLLTRFP